jgi:hypothetical protein
MSELIDGKKYFPMMKNGNISKDSFIQAVR